MVPFQGRDLGRIRRGGYIFDFWVGDHLPRHVHVLRDRKLIAKVELDEQLTVMEGKINRRIRKILKTLVKEGKLK
jgi:hypothetical protein